MTIVVRMAMIARFIPTLRRQRILALAAALTVCSCAFTYTDNDGNRHAIGFLDVTVRPPSDPVPAAGDVVEITSVGVSIGQTAQGGYLTVGFNREATAALRDNSAVLGNPIVSLAPVARQTDETAQ